MPRTKSFIPEEALRCAMRIFWRRGYAATSVRDLTEGMGINKFSLYDTFGSKEALFLAALDCYRDEVAGALLEELERPDADLSAIRRYFEALVEGAAKHQEVGGCLMTNTATELAWQGPKVRRRVRAHMERIRSAMQSALDRSVERGELHPSAATGLLAQHLLGASQSLAIASKSASKGEGKTFEGYVDWLIDSLGPRQ